MRDLLFTAALTAIGFTAAFLSLFQAISFHEFLIISTPGLVYGVWLSYTGRSSKTLIGKHGPAAMILIMLTIVPSMFYLYLVYSTGQYETALFYLCISMPLNIVAYVANWKTHKLEVGSQAGL